MNYPVKIKNALISVYYKEGLDKIVQKLSHLGVEIFSTGGTEKFISNLGIPVTAVEDITGYPSILGGRVKTLHPKIFGGILSRRQLEQDQSEVAEYKIPQIDLVIVDLYPFEETVKSGASESEIIEKIDIGGISLIRAAAKNYKDVLIVSCVTQYTELSEILEKYNGITDLEQRKKFASHAFHVSSHYDTAIHNYFTNNNSRYFKQSIEHFKVLRYGENPHQPAKFYGNLQELLEQLSGKELSYNNLLDIDAAINLMADIPSEYAAVAILKHNNACGMALRDNLEQAWKDALAADPVSAFGGIIICNKELDLATAKEIDKLFFEVLIAPAYCRESLDLLKQKKNRIILLQKQTRLPQNQFRTTLNGVLYQQKDIIVDQPENFVLQTHKKPTEAETTDLFFANILAKHTKSNTIVLVKNKQLLASGTGQTSRVDALKQAIEKAKTFNFDLKGAVMASDAFFPFPDCVEIAHQAGITAVIQPGGSVKDAESISYCNRAGLAMVFTGNRHFKH
jgi:phosphoribosylaminoimidazolecarboxamide formyltransferase/IMP cyclohydrolase